MNDDEDEDYPEEEGLDRTLSLQDDTYTLIFLAKPYSGAFWYAIGIAVLQIGFAIIGIQNTFEKTNHCDIQLEIPLIVTILQVMSLILPIYTIEGISKAIPMLRIPYEKLHITVEVDNLDYDFLVYDRNDHLIRSLDWTNPTRYSVQIWTLSLILRCILCFVIYLANILLVTVSNDISELLIKFTILVFLFEWSTLGLKAAKYNLLPRRLTQQINGLQTNIWILDENDIPIRTSATFKDFKIRNRQNQTFWPSFIIIICLFALGISLIGLRYDIFNRNLLAEWQGTCIRCYKIQVDITSTSTASVYSGNYVECDNYKHRPIFKKEFKSFGESNYEQFFYCKKNDRWVLTDNEKSKKRKCDDDWLLRSQKANKTFLIENLEETGWNYAEDNDDDSIYIKMTCLEHKTNSDIKKTKGECDKDNYIGSAPSNTLSFCNELIYFFNDNRTGEPFTLAKFNKDTNMAVTAYGHPVYERMTDKTVEIVIYAGHRWYHIRTSNVTMYDQLKNQTKWRELVDASEKYYFYYSNVAFNMVPTGSLNWFEAGGNNNYHPLSDGTETYDQKFECVVDDNITSIDCSNPDACNKNGICLENMLRKHNDKVTKNDEFFYCSEAMNKSSQYICGGKCRCNDGYLGEFCQDTSNEEGCKLVHVDFTSDVYIFHDIDLTEHLMKNNDSYAFFGIENFNRTSPPDLHFSHVSGIYVKNKIDGSYYQDGSRESVHGMFYYCTNYEAWVFTIIPLAIENGIVPNATKVECNEQYGWFIRSPRVGSLSLDMVPSIGWTVWTGTLAVNSDVTITCIECQFNTTCGVGHGICDSETNMCNCNESFEGLFCERSKPCMEIVKYNGTFYNKTLSNTINDVKMGQHEIIYGPFLQLNDTRKIHDRHVFVWNNTEEIQLILYAGFRWYHTYMTQEYYENFTYHLMKNTIDTYWSNILLDVTRYYSEETQNYIPTGDLQWFHNHKDNPLNLFDELVQFDQQQFECLNVTCDIPMACGVNGKCIGNVILAENNVVVTSTNDFFFTTCNESIQKSHEYSCGGKCNCSIFYDGHFCENKLFN